MNVEQKRLGLLLVLVAAVTVATKTLGVGFRLPNQDPKGIARANAFVATADNPSAIYYNPAGITQLEGHQVQAGIYLLHTSVSFDSPTGAHTRTKSKIQSVPQLYYTCSLKDYPWSLGLGIYVPYGLGMEWPESSPFRTSAIDGQLLYATVNPVVAWKINPQLSIGIGPTLNYSEVDFKRGIGLIPGDYFNFKGDDFDLGFNVGLRWQPHEKWAFGAKYHYLTTLNYRGDSIAVPLAPPTNTSAEIRFPQFFVAGVSFRPNEKWNLEFNVDWTDFDNVNDVVFHNTFAGDVVFPFHWNSSLMYEFGVTRLLGKTYSISAGYFFSENSIPDRTYNPIVPDSDLHLGSLGFGRRGKRWDWGLAYHFGIGHRIVKNDVVNPLANGTYDAFNQAVTISARFRF